jgi:glyoxylase-like metal-dependent hydrolase (beta-lactamase superfamily II)
MAAGDNTNCSSSKNEKENNDRTSGYETTYVAQGWGSVFREFRHSSCMMRPVALLMLFALIIFFSLTLMFQFPGIVLGLLMSPILQRNSFYIEFLYPLPIGRWGHFLLMSFTSKMRFKVKDKNQGFHSRTVEQKVEVVPGRVYIHFLPQWLDNVGYLLVCLPDSSTNKTSRGIGWDSKSIPPVGLVVDCGEMEAVVRSVELIQKNHYGNLPKIQLQSILSTHKHHDHTGGNAELLKHSMGINIRRVFGGAVENIPCCTDFLSDGEILPLPKFRSNNMNDLVEIEAIVVPAHTRGSLVYRLRSKVGEQAEYMFTGDTIFSGGAGVPFEADVGTETDKQLRRSNGHTHIRGTLGTIAMERCFTEVLSRAKPNNLSPKVGERILIFPGHEYTQELLVRQFQSMVSEHNKWKNFSPRDYFETVSNMYVAFHRRSLPHNSGRLLMIPSTFSREVHINTHMRSIRRSADLVVRALSFWHRHFCTTTAANERSPHGTRVYMDGSSGSSGSFDRMSIHEQQPLPKKTPSGFKEWNMNAKNVDDSVFTTVYTAELEGLIEDLSSGKIRKKKALDQLQVMIRRMETPVVNKRAIPGFLPSDKNIYRGICGLAILGSKPSALTISDSRKLKIPPPLDYNSDRILVSMKRLILVLTRLGVPQTNDGEDISSIIEKLWTEANEYCNPKECGKGYNSVDVESSHWRDEIEIGMLKWLMYGVTANQPSWFSKVFCMPCSPGTYKNNVVYPEHPASAMTKKAGDLVSHDVIECNLCRNATGCVQFLNKSVRSSSFDSNSANGSARLSLKETESDESGPVEANPEIEITQTILQETTGLAAGEHNTFFPA